MGQRKSAYALVAIAGAFVVLGATALPLAASSVERNGQTTVSAAASSTFAAPARDNATSPAPTTTTIGTTTIPATTVGPGTYYESVASPSGTRTFILYVPPSFSANLPLIVVYHGATDTAANTIKETDFESAANQSGEAVAFLQGYDNTWNEGAGHTPAERAHVDDVAYTVTVLAKIKTLVSFNAARVAAVGFSNGSLMVQYIGCRLANDFSLIVPVEGEIPVSVAAKCRPSRPISLYEIHGTADLDIPYGGGPFPGVGGGTTVLSAPSSVAFWAKRDGCRKKPRPTTPSTSIKLSTYLKCRGGAKVVLQTIIGGQHFWPSNIGQVVTQELSN